MAMVDVGHIATPVGHTGGLNAQVGWLGQRVGGRPALTYIRQMNRVNSRSGSPGHDDSTINIVLALLLLLLLLIIIIIIIIIIIFFILFYLSPR